VRGKGPRLHLQRGLTVVRQMPRGSSSERGRRRVRLPVDVPKRRDGRTAGLYRLLIPRPQRVTGWHVLYGMQRDLPGEAFARVRPSWLSPCTSGRGGRCHGMHLLLPRLGSRQSWRRCLYTFSRVRLCAWISIPGGNACRIAQLLRILPPVREAMPWGAPLQG
jgi:hypothetical protein